MNIAIISASTRLGRQTHKAALGLQKYLQQFEHLQPKLVDLLQYKIPLFEETLTRHPEPSNALRELGAILDRADAMLFVTPEYNGSYSPAMQNLFDHFPKQHHKAFGLVTASPGALGGMRAAMQLQQFVMALFGIPSPYMLVVPSLEKKFDASGNLLDDSFQRSIDLFVKEYLWLAERLVGAVVSEPV